MPLLKYILVVVMVSRLSSQFLNCLHNYFLLLFWPATSALDWKMEMNVRWNIEPTSSVHSVPLYILNEMSPTWISWFRELRVKLDGIEPTPWPFYGLKVEVMPVGEEHDTHIFMDYSNICRRQINVNVPWQKLWLWSEIWPFHLQMDSTVP